MPSFAATLKLEVRRLAAREIKRALRPLRRIQKQVKTLRYVSRAQRRSLATIQRRFERLKGRVATGQAAMRGAGRKHSPVSPEMVRSIRSRFGMTRLQFAKLLEVSPGSIFGWEQGRTTPRGGSQARILALRKVGAREARARVVGERSKAAKPGRRRGRGGRGRRARA
jgi:DNA-binding transcriptional regulator YiaG